MTEELPESNLWKAVLDRCLQDAQGNFNDCSYAHGHVRAIITSRARNFLLSGGGDFSRVCHLAGIDPGYMRKRARQLLETEQNS